MTSDARNDGIDGLRAIAALSVFAFHLSVLFQTPDNVMTSAFRQLNVGVWIFFVISGYLLYRPFARANASIAGPVEIGPYALRRVLRIYPAYWVALALVPWLLTPGSRFTDGQTAIKHVLLIQTYFPEERRFGLLSGLDQAWTLVIEVSFYAFLPLYAFAVRRVVTRAAATHADVRRNELRCLVVIGAVGLLANAWLSWNPPTGATLWLDVLPAHLTPFAIGMAGAVVRVHQDGSPPMRLPFGTAQAFAAAFAVWLVIVVVFHLTDPLATGWFLFFRNTLFSVVAGLVVVPIALRVDAGRVWRVLTSAPMRGIGLVSYGVYLYHWGILAWAAEHWPGREARFTTLTLLLVALPASLLAGAASWYLVERPALRLARRRPRAAGAAATAAVPEPPRVR